MPPFLPLLALAGILEFGKGIFQVSAANEQMESLDLKNDFQVLQSQQKRLSTYSLLEKTLASQTAEVSTRGVSFGSPSFNAIQRETLNIGGRELKNQEVEQDFLHRNLQIEKSNVRKTLYASLFGDVADLAMSGAKLMA